MAYESDGVGDDVFHACPLLGLVALVVYLVVVVVIQATSGVPTRS